MTLVSEPCTGRMQSAAAAELPRMSHPLLDPARIYPSKVRALRQAFRPSLVQMVRQEALKDGAVAP